MNVDTDVLPGADTNFSRNLRPRDQIVHQRIVEFIEPVVRSENRPDLYRHVWHEPIVDVCLLDERVAATGAAMLQLEFPEVVDLVVYPPICVKRQIVNVEVAAPVRSLEVFGVDVPAE